MASSASIIASQLSRAGVDVVSDVHEVSPKERFYVIPDCTGPRWIIPNNPQIGLPILNQWKPYAFSSGIKWNVIKVAYRAGQMAKIPNVTEIGLKGVTLNHFGYLELVDKFQYTPVLYIGRPGLRQKAIAIFVNNAIFQSAFVAKVAIGPQADRNIFAEEKILTRLDDEKPGMAPKPLFKNLKRGIAIQEAVHGLASGRRLTFQHLDYLKQLRMVGEYTSLSVQVQKLEDALEELSTEKGFAKRTVRGILGYMSDHHSLPAVWVHGDFAPYNCKIDQHKRIKMLDWEDACPFGMPCYDIYHFINVQKYLFGKKRLNMTGHIENMGIRQHSKAMNVPDFLLHKLELFYMAREAVSRFAQDEDDKYAFYLCDCIYLESKNL